MTTNTAMIDFELAFTYEEETLPALHEVSGTIEQGKCVVLCGGSGCGKSTLLRCINHLIPRSGCGPTANLDFSAINRLRELLLRLKQEGKTLLLSEHRLHYLNGIADEYWIMADGRIQCRLDPESLMSLYSIVFQDVTLFNNTVMENIRLGRKEATDEEVLAGQCR